MDFICISLIITNFCSEKSFSLVLITLHQCKSILMDKEALKIKSTEVQTGITMKYKSEIVVIMQCIVHLNSYLLFYNNRKKKHWPLSFTKKSQWSHEVLVCSWYGMLHVWMASEWLDWLKEGNTIILICHSWRWSILRYLVIIRYLYIVIQCIVAFKRISKYRM